MKIIIDQCTVKKLKALLHWLKTFSRTSIETYIYALYQSIFSEAL